VRKPCGQSWADHLPMKTVKELMGHANISPTVEIYRTVSEDHLPKSRWILEAVTGDSEAAVIRPCRPHAVDHPLAVQSRSGSGQMENIG
jgi:hypothetical protein